MSEIRGVPRDPALQKLLDITGTGRALPQLCKGSIWLPVHLFIGTSV